MRKLLALMIVLFVADTGLPQTGDRPQIPNNLIVKLETADRFSDRKDRHGAQIPPWTKIEIEAHFDRQMMVGDKVTVIPINVDSAPLTLEITGAEELESCVEDRPAPWSVNLQPIMQSDLLQVAPVQVHLGGRYPEKPFDVVVIYPAVKSAREIPKPRLTEKSLPKGVRLRDVQAALDLTDDGSPDVIVTYYCCDGRSQTLTSCDLSCGETYLRRGGEWKTIASERAC